MRIWLDLIILKHILSICFVDKKLRMFYLNGMDTRSEFGFFCENLAADFLKERGYVILDTNFRKPWGELDVVCQKDDVVVFVEVKANKKDYPGFEPELRASGDKLRKVIRTARTYLAYKQYLPDQEWRVDVVSITLNKDRGAAKIRHYKNV